MKDIIIFADKGMNPDQAARGAIAADARYFVHNAKVYCVAYEYAECGNVAIIDWGKLNPSDVVRVK